MKTRDTFAHLALLLICGCAAARPTQDARAVPSRSSQLPAPLAEIREETAHSATQNTPPELAHRPKQAYEEGDFILDNVRLSEGLETLLERAVTNNWALLRLIEVDWEDLKAAGITKETRVNVRKWSPTVGSALKSIIESASKGTNANVVFYDDGHSIIKITTRERHLSRDGLIRELGMRRYLVEILDRDEVANDDKVRELPIEEPAGGLFAAGSERVITGRQRMDAIARLIKEIVDPESWEHKEWCYVRSQRDRLIIRQTEENHKAIAHLFEQLDETRASGPVLEVRVRPTTKPAATQQAATHPAR